jgi:hypothetical protein
MTAKDRDRDDDEKERDGFVPEITWEQFRPLLDGWYDEVTGTEKGRKGWFAIQNFDGKIADRELIISVNDLNSDEINTKTVEKIVDSNSPVTEAGVKSDINSGDENFVENYVWRKLEKYSVICTIPHISKGYPVENDERNKNKGDLEIVVKIPEMIDFWKGDANNPESFSPNPDVARILYYLIEHWDTYSDPSESGVDSADILKIDSKGAVIYAVAGRHMKLESPSVVFKKIEPDDDYMGNYLTIEGEITGKNMEIYDELGLELELTALLRLFTLTSCLPKRIYERFLTPEEEQREQGKLPVTPETEMEVPVNFHPEEDGIDFKVIFGPANLGGDR